MYNYYTYTEDTSGDFPLFHQHSIFWRITPVCVFKFGATILRAYAPKQLAFPHSLLSYENRLLEIGNIAENVETLCRRETVFIPRTASPPSFSFERFEYSPYSKLWQVI